MRQITTEVLIAVGTVDGKNGRNVGSNFVGFGLPTVHTGPEPLF